MGTRSFAVICGIVAFVLASAPVAAEAEDAAASAANPVLACVEAANERQLEIWTCMGGTLTYFDENAEVGGKALVVSEQIALTTVSMTTGSTTTSSPLGAASAMSTTDPDNYWCETGASVCTNIGNDFNGKVKGNIIWGNTSGVFGEFDLVLKTKLNGRQSQAFVKVFRDSGASLTFTYLRVECQHHGNAFGCGSKNADNGDGIVSVTTSWIGPQVNGNRLEQKGTYNDRLAGRVTPTGAPVLPLPNLNAPNFVCPTGTSGCTFP